MADTTYTDDLDLEAESKKRLSDVTNRLNKSRADLAFSMSNEGKELQILLKQQQDLLKAATGRLGVEERTSASASEIKSIEEEIKLLKAGALDEEFKNQKKLVKLQKKRQEAELEASRTLGTIGSELASSLNPLKGMKSALEGIVPKPIMLMAEGLTKLSGMALKATAKKAWGAAKWVGRATGRGAKALGKKALGARPEEPVEHSMGVLSKAHTMGRGAAFGTDPITGEPVKAPTLVDKIRGKVWKGADKAKELKGQAEGFVGGVKAKAAETIAPAKEFVGDVKASASRVYAWGSEEGPAGAAGVGGAGGEGGEAGPAGEGGEARPASEGGEAVSVGGGGDGFGLLHIDLVAMTDLLRSWDMERFVTEATTAGSIYVHDKDMGEKIDDQTDTTKAALDQQTEDLEPETVDTSVEREGDIESKIPFVGKKKGKKKKGGLLSKIGGGLMAGLGIPAWATDPTMLANMVGGGAKAGMGKLWSGASKAFSSPKFAKVMGPAAIAAGVAMMVKDGMAGIEKSEEWGTSKVSGALGGALGGVDKGFKGAFKNMGKWALIGAGIGSFVPVIGTAVGGVIGAVVGAILGWIGGERIAKFFDGVGKWVSEKWDLIKAFPGKIWGAIVNTVKGWLGFGDGGEEEVPVKAEGEPKKGWLDTIIDFLIPQWIRDFAKDAVGTVLGWLGLTKTDEETGEISATDMGKKVFGVIGSTAGLLFKIATFFVPQAVIDFVAHPVNTILGWLGLTEKDEEGKTTVTDKGKEVFKIIGTVGDLFMNIVKRFIPQGLIDFVKDPIDWILIKIGWKTAEGEATAAGGEAVKVLESGTIKDKASLLKGVLLKLIPDKLKKIFEMGLVDWVLWKIGWKTEEGEATKEGEDAVGVLKDGTIKDKLSLFKDVVKKLIPDALKKIFEMGLTDWVLWKIGWKDEGGAITDEGAKAVGVRDAIMNKIKAMVAAILPEPGGLIGKWVVPDAVYVWAGLKPSKEVMAAEERVEERKDKLSDVAEDITGVSSRAKTQRTMATRRSTNQKANIKKMEEELRQSQLFISSGGKEGKDTVTNLGNDVEAEQQALQKKKDAIAAAKTQLTSIEGQEQQQLTAIDASEQGQLKKLNEQQVILQAEQTADQKIVAGGTTLTADVLGQAQAGGTIPLAVALYSKEGKDLGIKSTAEAAKALQRAAPQDFDATATISTTGTPGGAAPVIVNNVSNNSSGGSTSAPTNNYLNITANATDPYTSKQPNLAYKRY